jgi:magnesium chelatase family protein
MSLAMVFSRALDGLAAPEVHVEVQLANGLPSFTLVGLADTEVKESRERVRAALQQSGYAFPHNKRITVNLAPADLPKESGRFDLPIALGILAAAGVIDTARLASCEFAGELSLAGELRPVRGALALALALRQGGSARTLVLPVASARAAAQVPGLDVRGAASLAEVVASLLPGEAAVALPAAAPLPAQASQPGPDLRDVKGQAAAKRALEIAAAGAHSLLIWCSFKPIKTSPSMGSMNPNILTVGYFEPWLLTDPSRTPTSGFRPPSRPRARRWRARPRGRGSMRSSTACCWTRR